MQREGRPAAIVSLVTPIALLYCHVHNAPIMHTDGLGLKMYWSQKRWPRPGIWF